jgi:glutathione S-transferase
MTRANRTPEFLANVNPLRGIPVLALDDGTHIAESVAICRYFEALHPEPSLFGRAPADIGRIDMGNRRVEMTFMMPVGLAWVHGSPLTKPVVKN